MRLKQNIGFILFFQRDLKKIGFFLFLHGD